MKLNNIFLFVALLACLSYSQWSVNPAGGSIRARDSMRVDSLRNSVAIGTDSNGKFVKRDSVRASHKADTADFSDCSDSSRISYYSIVQKTRMRQSHIPIVNLDSSLIDSSWDNGGSQYWTSNVNIGSSTPAGPLLYVTGKKTATPSPTIALLNSSSTAGTAGRLFFQNFSSSFGYNRGGFEFGLYKKTTATNTGYNDFRLRSYSVTSQYMDHMFINDSLGQICFNHAKSDIYRLVWPPLLIENGGLDVVNTVQLRSTPTPVGSSLSLVLGKTSDGGDTIFANSIESLALPHNVTAGQIPMSIGGSAWRNTGTTVDTVTGNIHFYGDLIMGDTAYTGVTASIHGHGNSIDVNKDSLVLNLSAAPLGQSTRGSAIRVSGNESSLHGNVIVEAGDSGSVLSGGNDLQIHLDHPSDTSLFGVPTFKTDIRIGRDSVELSDTNRSAIYGSHRSRYSAFNIYGGQGSSTTKSSIELGNKISNAVNINGDTVNIGGLARASYLDATKITADTIDASMVIAPHGVPSGRHAVSTGTSTWGQSTIRESTDSTIGIGGAASSDRRCAVYFAPLNAGSYGIYSAYSPTVTTSGYIAGGEANRFLTLTNISSGQTDNNPYGGSGGYCYHNSPGRAYGGVYGLQFGYGTLGNSTGQCDAAYGMIIDPRSEGLGPIGTMTSIYIGARTGAVTPGTEWCINSLHNALSRFRGKVESGTATNKTGIDSLGLHFDGVSRINWKRYYPDSVTYTEGSSPNSINALAHIGDSVYTVVEASGGTGIDATVHFNNVTGFNMIQIVGGYSGASTHAVSIMLRDTTKSQWHTYSAMRYVDVVDTTASSRCLYNYSFFPDSTQNYIASNGRVKLRLLHKGSGNSTHRAYFSEIVLKQ